MIYAMAVGKVSIAVQAIVFICSYRWYRSIRTGPGHPIVSLMMLAIHPVWYLNAYSGDCGMGLEMLSIGALGLSIGLAIWQFEMTKKVKDKLP